MRNSITRMLVLALSALSRTGCELVGMGNCSDGSPACSPVSTVDAMLISAVRHPCVTEKHSDMKQKLSNKDLADVNTAPPS